MLSLPLVIESVRLHRDAARVRSALQSMGYASCVVHVAHRKWPRIIVVGTLATQRSRRRCVRGIAQLGLESDVEFTWLPGEDHAEPGVDFHYSGRDMIAPKRKVDGQSDGDVQDSVMAPNSL